MKVGTEGVPHVPDGQRLGGRGLDQNVFVVTVRYGFMDEPNIPRALAQIRASRLRCNLIETSFFVGREKIVPIGRSELARWQKQLFIFMNGSMLSATEFLRIPSNRVVELGGQVEI